MKKPFHKSACIGILALTSIFCSCAQINYQQIPLPRNVDGYIKKIRDIALNPPQGPGVIPQSQIPSSRPTTIARGRLKEPSGICWHSRRKTLFAVGDNGDIVELTADGAVVNHRRIRDSDFEGITSDPSTGMLYAAVEGADRVLEIEPNSLSPRRAFNIPRFYRGRTVMKAGGNGIEAITFIPNSRHPEGGIFCVSNQGGKNPMDAKGIFFVNLPIRSGRGQPRIVRSFTPALGDIAGLHYDRRSGRLFAISDSKDTLLTYSSSYQLINRSRLRGRNQEGITMDDSGNMYIAQDSGGILKFRRPTPQYRP